MDKDPRQKLIDSATPLFAWKGYAGVSIRELAKAADVNSAMISYYFGGKEGLYAAVLDLHLAHLLSVIEGAFSSSEQPEERVAAFIKAISNMHQEHPTLLRLMQGELSNPTVCFEKVVVKYFKKFIAYLPATMAAGKETGVFAQDIHPVYAAIALASMVNFYFILKPLAEQILPPEEKHDEEYLKQVLRIYLKGVKEA